MISSETAAGYGDFVKQLKNNPRGFKFKLTLFQAFMQGNETERSVIQALEQIYQHYTAYDLVVIIRGGGSQAELNYFNNYNIAFHITQFPVPVLTGIGHDRDQTITDMVAHTSLKTPTAVAEFIIGLMNETAGYLDQLEQQVISLSTGVINESRDTLGELGSMVRNLTKMQLSSIRGSYLMLENNFNQKIRGLLPQRISGLNHLQQKFEAALKYNLLLHKMQLNRIQQTIPGLTRIVLKKEKTKMQVAESLIAAYNPENILKRGYSVTYMNGKVIYSPQEVKPGDTLDTKLFEGCISSIVK